MSQDQALTTVSLDTAIGEAEALGRPAPPGRPHSPPRRPQSGIQAQPEHQALSSANRLAEQLDVALRQLAAERSQVGVQARRVPQATVAQRRDAPIPSAR